MTVHDSAPSGDRTSWTLTGRRPLSPNGAHAVGDSLRSPTATSASRPPRIPDPPMHPTDAAAPDLRQLSDIDDIDHQPNICTHPDDSPASVRTSTTDRHGHEIALEAHHRGPLGRIAVGTAVAGGPPLRSRRAHLTHGAPAQGVGVKALVREGMHPLDGWEVTGGDVGHPIPPQVAALASTL